MKGIMSIVIVFICLFSAGASNAEYYVEPYVTPAATMDPLEGNYWKLHAPFYPDPYFDCHTNEEVNDFLFNNPGGWTELNVAMGPCKKCSSLAWELWPYNGQDVCIYYIPCGDGYEFINYKGRDDCFKCPDNYKFNDDYLCQWAGEGPQPPIPPPSIPTGLEASDGTTALTVVISWNESNFVTDYYVLLQGYEFRGEMEWALVPTIVEKQ